MKVLILGSGLLGTATAWYLAGHGHEVTVVDRQPGSGLETSFANGGQISACHAEPWANPDAPLKILKWLARDDAPLLFRLRMDPAQWTWGLQFLMQCTPGRTRDNIRQILAMSVYSRTSLQQLRAETGIQYDHATRGILHYYTQASEFAAAADASRLMNEHGLDREIKTPAEALAIEPALANAKHAIVGATYTASDESGDAHLFTKNLAAMAAAKGVVFRYGLTIRRLLAEGGAITAVQAVDAEGRHELLKADAYVVALGAHSPKLTAPVGVPLPVYPAKGYSATFAISDPARAPTVSLTDDEAKIVFSRLGNRLRIAGTAELSGFSTDLNPVRCEALTKRARDMFPGAADYDHPTYWAGLRPSTPSNVPLVGRTKVANLYVNTGHGTLGWTMACGSGRALADIISGRRPEVDFRFL